MRQGLVGMRIERLLVYSNFFHHLLHDDSFFNIFYQGRMITEIVQRKHMIIGKSVAPRLLKIIFSFVFHVFVTLYKLILENFQ
jgi:hypothetical protein